MRKSHVWLDISRSMFNNIDVGIYRNTPGPKGKFIEVNEALARLFGYHKKEEFIKNVRPIDTYYYPRQRNKLSNLLLKKGFVHRKELLLKKKDGSPIYASITATAVKNKQGKVKWFDGIIEDITHMRHQRERFRLIFEHSPIAIWEEDFSAIARLLKQLRQSGVKDFRKYFSQHPEIVLKAFRNIKIIDVNKAALALYGAKSKRQLMTNFGKTFTKSAARVIVFELMALASGERFFESEFKSKTLDGKMYDVVLRVAVPDGYEKTLSRVIVTIQNITDQKRLEQHLKNVAQQDGLTKLLNSRAIAKRLDEELIRCKRYHVDLSCMMVDVDNFKSVNDKFGHQRGDQILKKVANTIKNTLRRSDIVGRYGGDEFFAILTQTKAENAKIAAERIRKEITSLNFRAPHQESIKVTISVGISGFPSEDINDYRDLITKADKALYLAKASGRDCTILSS